MAVEQEGGMRASELSLEQPRTPAAPRLTLHQLEKPEQRPGTSVFFHAQRPLRPPLQHQAATAIVRLAWPLESHGHDRAMAVFKVLITNAQDRSADRLVQAIGRQREANRPLTLVLSKKPLANHLGLRQLVQQ